MRRRDFLGVLGGAASWPLVAWPLTARAQQPVPMRLIAVEMAFAQDDPDGKPLVAAFEQTLQQLGWVLGQNLRIEYRWGATDPERARVRAAELMKLNPDLIVAHATLVTRAFAEKTNTIPIVFTNVSDPIGEQFVKSFPAPGGNITGFTNVEPTMGGKYLQLLKEIAPTVTRVAMIFNPNSAPGHGSYFSGPFEAAAPGLSVQPIKAAVQNVADIEQFVSAIAVGDGGGVIIIGEPFTNRYRSQILELTTQYRLPTICPYRFYAKNGCLISYGVDFPDQFQRAANYVDRILKGATPEMLPVQSPVKFELVINLNTAKTLGLTVSPMLIARADEVIE
jgi:putative tryptophan/tyrosine transport system substrate-binding protein